MFEISKIILKENSRNLIKKIKETPVLYFIFTAMTVFSILIFAFGTFYLLTFETNFNISLEDVFFTLFFIFAIKTVADIHNNFIISNPITYTLSTQINQKRTIFEIFISVLFVQMIIWFSFSFLYLLFLTFFGIDIYYPVEYLYFTLGIVGAVFIGFSISINFFSPKKYRLIPTIILLAFFFDIRHPLYIILTMPLGLLHVVWSIKNSMESYLYLNRKERTKERSQVKMRGVIKAIFHKETTVLWRDKLLIGFIFTSVSTGLFSGYFFLYGDEILIPEFVREYFTAILPSLFLFLAIFIVVMYTAVFPSLNLFLNEEKTMWLVRHIPIKNDIFVFGKTSALSLCFLTSIPVIPYLVIFLGLENITYLIWFLCFSYLAGVIVAVPLGVKYVGKKSDIILLYSVAMILLLILGIMTILKIFIDRYIEQSYIVYILIIAFEIIILYFSLKMSSKILSIRYKSDS